MFATIGSTHPTFGGRPNERRDAPRAKQVYALTILGDEENVLDVDFCS